MNRLAATFSVAAMLWTPFAGAQGAAQVPDEQVSAVHALYTLPSQTPAYSFSDLYRLSLEAEADLAGRGLMPVGTAEVVRPAPVSAVTQNASTGANTPALKTTDVREAKPWALPRPAGWLMALSGLAVIGFIAWRRSEGVD